MGLRCLLFSSDEGTSASIRQILEDLGIEGESCPEAVTAVQQVTQQAYQFVIIDWDQQPEAGLVLTAARERKANERPLTLAIVSHDHNVPKALQAGANSILRKPIVLNQAKDTLTTARDLLRARQESAAAAAAGAAAKAQSSTASVAPSSLEEDDERTLRGAEFLPSSVPAPSGQFDTESDVQKSMEQSETQPIDPLKELEPMAAAVTRSKPAPAAPPPPTSNEPRGLQWYLNQRAAAAPKMAPEPQPPASAATVASPSAAPEILGFDQMPTQPSEWHQSEEREVEESAPESSTDAASSGPDTREQKNEAQLFAYIAGESEESEEKPHRSFRLGKSAIVGALMLAACAVAATPQAPWHARLQVIWKQERQALHAWLNPTVVTPTQAPESHENFGRAGDEYKLPVVENIPDATTDPSQIRVTPVVDPTAKKTPGADQTPQEPVDAPAANPGAAASGSEVQVEPSQVLAVAAGPASTAGQPGGDGVVVSNSAATSQTATAPPSTVIPPALLVQMHPDQPISLAPDNTSQHPAPQKSPQVQTVSNVATPPIPSSLKSQMATMAPEASGNKPPEAALPSIEPVNISETAARALLTDQPALAYPAGAKGQQGTVILQVLIGRDGTVQDAKFLQGSFAFAKTAIDSAKQWKFKPYMLNGRPVSVQTSLTMIFKPPP